MEQNYEFKRVTAKIKAIEEQLSLGGATSQLSDQSGKEAEKEIEEHFAKCFNALAERKAFLLKELAQQVSQRKKIEEARLDLVTSLEGCKKVLNTGSYIYPSSQVTAEKFWKCAENIPFPFLVCDRGVKVNLPASLLDAIHIHGKVLDKGLFSQADMISTLAGIKAEIKNPFGICLHNEHLYVTNIGDNSIRKVTLQGEVTTFPTAPNVLKRPYQIVPWLKDGSFFVYDSTTYTIVQIASSGTTKLIAGSGNSAHHDGIGSAASFVSSLGMTIDQQTGNLFVVNNHSIRKVTPQGEVSTLAGSAKPGFADGDGTAAMFSSPFGVTFDESSQSLLVCDSGNKKIRRVQLNGKVTTLCDVPMRAKGIAVTSNNTILVTSDTQVWKITNTESNKYEATVLAGSGIAGTVDGSPSECRFKNLLGITVHEPSHSCFVADHSENTIRKISFKP